MVPRNGHGERLLFEWNMAERRRDGDHGIRPAAIDAAGRISFNCCMAVKSRFAVGSSRRKISVSVAHAERMEMSCRSPLDSA